ncbi:glycerol kinase [Palaeococcus pacificus DY20341]|uniref:Glycerol kinase n=1 Tax=Palaeococcus pacificus DY20341 TaxID=1343739 RepID=A0A075LWM8_9EURY|nr:glycerol kinase GlpK [Palaeococcus pacificus]AIF68948.1 glycerol kinase [Palaeococcus pacificus DY20341]
MDKVILSLDEGTTSARAIIFDRESNILGVGQYEFPQYYPKPGWVEHNPEEIWEAQLKAVKAALENAKVSPEQIAAIGVTNQRETTIIWDKNGKPVYNAIVWQCRRTAEMVEDIKRNYGEMIKAKTGLIPDAYFSASKIKWLLDNVPELRRKAEKGEVMFGTIDTFLIYKLTGEHVTDYSNASRTMLFNIKKLEWDEELLEIFGIPDAILPEVKESSEIYGYTKLFGKELPVSGDAGDQQAALFGQACFDEGMVKATYGTGNFILVNTGKELRYSKNLLTTIAWGFSGDVTYALEGSVFITGAAVQWLRDGIKIIKSAAETEELASKLASNEGLYFVPAFVGLGAPYWDQFARGLIIGITRGTSREHLVRATLEAIAYLTRDVVEEMEEEVPIKELRVDGGATGNSFLMRFQSDILGKRVIRPVVQETTALGAAYLAGLAVDYWESLEEIKALWKAEKVFEPKMSEDERGRLYKGWKEAVKRALGWAKVVGV